MGMSAKRRGGISTGKAYEDVAGFLFVFGELLQKDMMERVRTPNLPDSVFVGFTMFGIFQQRKATLSQPHTILES